MVGPGDGTPREEGSRPVVLSLDGALGMCRTGEIHDAKTELALLDGAWVEEAADGLDKEIDAGRANKRGLPQPGQGLRLAMADSGFGINVSESGLHGVRGDQGGQRRHRPTGQ